MKIIRIIIALITILGRLCLAAGIGMILFGIARACYYAWFILPDGWSTIASQSEQYFAENLLVNALILMLFGAIVGTIYEWFYEEINSL